MDLRLFLEWKSGKKCERSVVLAQRSTLHVLYRPHLDRVHLCSKEGKDGVRNRAVLYQDPLSGGLLVLHDFLLDRHYLRSCD